MAPRRNAASAEPAPAGLAARQVALDSVAQLLGASRGLALEDALAQASRHAGLDAADAGLARAIATATFRRLGSLRDALAARMPQGVPDGEPRLLALLATGAVQILDLNVPDHAAVDIAVRLAKADPQLQHLGGLVNAVLRRIAREAAAIRTGETETWRNTPPWLMRRWQARYGQETANRIAAAPRKGAAVDVAALHDGWRWGDRLGGLLLDLGSIRLAAIRTSVTDLPGYGDGAWWVQDAAAALPARLLAVVAGERVADLCAAPGGKTAQLAASGAHVVSVDRSGPRLERLRGNLERLRLEAEIRTADILELPEDETFDAVLLDAPCSATGTIRRHPDVAWTKTEADIGRLAGLQTRLLDKAARLVRPGGRLVYCTCSLEPEEGERQAEAFARRQPGFARVPIAPDELGGRAELIDANGDLRTLPCHLDGGGPDRAGGLDGFFASRFRRLT